MNTSIFKETITAHGNIYAAEFKGFRVEMNLDKTWLNIIDSESRCECCVINADGDVVSETGEVVTENWSDADWQNLSTAIKTR